MAHKMSAGKKIKLNKSVVHRKGPHTVIESYYITSTYFHNYEKLIMNLTFFFQGISEDTSAPYMLLYPSELGEHTYTAVPQAVAEVLVTSNMGEQQVELHLIPQMSKSGDVQSNNLTPEQVHATLNSQVAMAATNEVSMATAQEVSIATSGHVGVTTQQLHPPSQVNYMMEGNTHQHPQVAAVSTVSSHLVVDSGQQPMNFVADPQAAVIHEVAQPNILQTGNYSYANSTQLINSGNSFESPNNSQNIELAHVPILTYSELQTSSEIQEASNVQIVPNENSSVEQDIARTLIQINENHLE